MDNVNNQKLTVNAVVVTYNRLALLQESILAIRSQTYKVANIIVINNSSTDGTKEWLDAQEDIKIITQQNLGGAWGFYEGVKQAYHLGADWIWLMDDDSIPLPSALEKLVDAIHLTKKEGDNFGFFGSKVVWTDGSIHLMNKQIEAKEFLGTASKQFYLENDIRPVIFNSFVSFLVSTQVVEKIGLPIKEFFIWADDIEYSMRVLKNGFKGALVSSSIVLHKTPENHTSNIYKDNEKSIWKHAYGLRNELYIRHHYKSKSSYYRNVFKGLFLEPFRIINRRKNHKWAFIKVIWKSTISSLNFDPKIETVE